METDILIRKNNKKVMKKTYTICPRCYLPKKKTKLIKCSGSCKMEYCFHCLTQIDDIFYCPDCLSDFIKKDVALIIKKE